MYHPSDDKLIASTILEIDQITERFKNEFSDCTSEQIWYKPSSDTWSIAENIQHLIVLNSSYFPIFSHLLGGTYRAPWSGKFSIIYNYLGKIILKSVNEDRSKKIRTFPLWLPDKNPSAGDILEKFELHQAALRDWVIRLSPLLGKGTVINSPANKLITYTLDDALKIMITHERRHLNQAIEVRDIK